MAKTLQFRRGTTSELSSVSGSVAELFVNTEKDTVVVMDGSTNGGFELTQNNATQTLTNKIIANSICQNQFFTESTISIAPSLGGNFDLSYEPTQTTQETPFTNGETDAFGVNLTVFKYDMMDPIGQTINIDLGAFA